MKIYRNSKRNPSRLPLRTYRRTLRLLKGECLPSEVINRALDVVPEEYRRGVWANIRGRGPCPTFASRDTWRHWKAVFIHAVAVNLDEE